MLLDRRAFILTASSFAVGYSSLCPPALHASPPNAAIADPPTGDIGFRIDGWIFDPNSSAEEYSIRVNQNWRCVWR